MATAPTFDLAAAHQFFSAHCFNRSWDLIEKKDRTPAEDRQLIALAHASLWHWTEREDCLPKNLLVAYWLLSRVYSVVRQAKPAQHYASLALTTAQSASVRPYFLGCAYEAVARAAALAGDSAVFAEASREAREIAQSLEDEGDRKMLLADIDSIAH